MKKLITIVLLVCSYYISFSQNIAKEYFDKAEKFSESFEDNKNDSADFYYTLAIKANPNYYEAYLGRAENIREHHLMVIPPNYLDEIKPNDGIYYAELDYSEKILILNDLLKASEIKPNSKKVYLELGEIYEILNDTVKAIEFYQKAIQYGSIDGYYEKGRLLKYYRMYEDAIANLKLYLRSSGNKNDKIWGKFIIDNTYNNLAYCNYMLGNYNQALKFLSYSSQDNYHFKSLCWYNLGNLENAIAEYDSAINVKPEESFYYFKRGILKMEKKNYFSAIKDFNRCIELNSDEPNAYYNRGKCKFNLDDYRGCILDMKKVINKRDNPFEWDYYWLGISYNLIKEYKLATEVLSKAININSEIDVFYYQRGIAYYNNQKKNEACIDWSIAGEKGYEEAYKIIKDYCK